MSMSMSIQQIHIHRVEWNFGMLNLVLERMSRMTKNNENEREKEREKEKNNKKKKPAES